MTSQAPASTSTSASPPNRKRSVQFTSSPSPSSKYRIPANYRGGDHDEPDAAPHQTGESSADEITPIISHPKQHKSTSRYDGGGSNNDPSSTTSSKAISNPRKRSSKPKHPASSSSRNETDSADHGNNTDDAEDENPSGLSSYLRNTAEKYGTLTLENKGSVARDHLALERTFLAWLRTSLAFASIGIAVTQLFRLNTTIKSGEGLTPVQPPSPSSSSSPGSGGGSSGAVDSVHKHLRQMGKPLGATFLGIAMVVLIVGARRYFEAQYWIVRGMFPASRGSVLLITAIAAALIIASLVVVLVVEPSVFERR